MGYLVARISSLRFSPAINVWKVNHTPILDTVRVEGKGKKRDAVNYLWNVTASSGNDISFESQFGES